MKSTPFDPKKDLAPIPFNREACGAAKIMKQKGLKWQPQVGCFVWDEKKVIEVSSPFPHRIYFVLNLGHFLRRFDTLENMAEQLIWLPTWFQARQICRRLEIPAEKLVEALPSAEEDDPESELLRLYRSIAEHL